MRQLQLTRGESAESIRHGQEDAERLTLFRRFKDKLGYDDALNRTLVSYQASKRRPFLRWFKYKEAFSSELVEYFLGGQAPRPDCVVLDPFA